MAWRSLCLILLLALGALGSAAAQEAITPSERVTRNVVVRATPSTASAAVGKLLPGDSASVLGDVPGWYRVQLPDGAEGFVSKAWTEATAAPLAAVAAAAGGWKAHIIDVGTGLAVFVEGPDFALLYDAGTQDDLARGDDNRVVAYIHAVRPDLRTLDHVILSHPHKDHLELMPEVFDAFVVRNIWDSGRVNPTAGYCRFLTKVVAEPGAVYHDALASNATRTVTFKGSTCKGDVVLREGAMMTADPVPLGAGAQMTMLYRDGLTGGDPNHNSVVVRLDLGGRRLLLAGDAEGGERQPPSAAPKLKSIEAELLKPCCVAGIAADVLVVGHHGSLTSSRNAFINAVGAKLYVISSGPHAYSKVVLPDQAVVDALKLRGKVMLTNVRDGDGDGPNDCAQDPAKPGPDADESPGGCDNIRILFSPAGLAPNAAYFKPAD